MWFVPGGEKGEPGKIIRTPIRKFKGILTRRTMDIHTKLRILEDIYSIHEGFAADRIVACDRYCSTCCTRNVTMTALEGYKILQHLTSIRKMEYLQKVSRDRHQNRFCPEITINHLASLWVRGEDAPGEEGCDAEGKCPLLEDDLCAVYPVRPFGCRCFFSEKNCADTGFADLDPYVLTVNTLFLQFIEHVDAGGLFGNLTDIVLFLEKLENRNVYANNGPLHQKGPLLLNRPIPALLIPPEHQDRIGGILSKLQNIKIPMA